jgi:hypothetical protein
MSGGSQKRHLLGQALNTTLRQQKSPRTTQDAASCLFFGLITETPIASACPQSVSAIVNEENQLESLRGKATELPGFSCDSVSPITFIVATADWLRPA